MNRLSPVFTLIKNNAIFRLGITLTMLIVPMALAQTVYPIVLHDSWRTWAFYWVYLFFGVILPGMMVLLSTVSWKTDWLNWAGLGWAVGYGLELVSLQLAKQFNAPILFVLWIPLAYLFAIKRYKTWAPKIAPFQRKIATTLAILVLFILGGTAFFALNLPELSSRPPYTSDVWFHINNAQEYRNFLTVQDPRISGEPFNYPMFSYAPTVAASLVTGGPIANLLTRFVGMSCIWLFALLLFNTGRTIGRGSILSGVISTGLLIFPVDASGWFSSRVVSGTNVIVYGDYISTTTLAGFIFLTALVLPIYWSYETQKTHWSTDWVIALFAFVGAGTKSMFAPLVICAAGGSLVWEFIHRRFSRKTLFRFLLITVPATLVSAPLVFGADSYSESIRWQFGDFAKITPIYGYLTGWGLPDWIAISLWLLFFCFLFLVGAVFATWMARKNPQRLDFFIFCWLLFTASLVPAMFIALRGYSQLFFLYYGLAFLAGISGVGLKTLLLDTPARLKIPIQMTRGAVIAVLLFITIIKLPKYPLQDRLFKITGNAERRVTNWWADAFSNDSTLPRSNNLNSSFTSNLYAQKLNMTENLAQGLTWARQNLPKDAIFAVNVPGAAAYAGLSERRAFFETDIFSLMAHISIQKGEVNNYFAWRVQLLNDWKEGKPDVFMRMNKAGVTYLYVDNVNGKPVTLPPVGFCVYFNEDYAVYKVP